MVAYSFKKRFVGPIKVGLASPEQLENYLGEFSPKRQTIRADRKRHARPGEEVQLYCGMRTKQCFLIGRARCTLVAKINLYFGSRQVWVDEARVRDVDGFARGDGFSHFEEMQAFWDAEHGVGHFNGVLIQWEPL